MDGVARLSWVYSHVQSVSFAHHTVKNWVEIDNYIGLGDDRWLLASIEQNSHGMHLVSKRILYLLYEDMLKVLQDGNPDILGRPSCQNHPWCCHWTKVCFHDQHSTPVCKCRYL
jgi:hypothetical protein